ncbi:hypothetical protein Tco_1403780 [Tanacetum coccineum]
MTNHKTPNPTPPTPLTHPATSVRSPSSSSGVVTNPFVDCPRLTSLSSPTLSRANGVGVHNGVITIVKGIIVDGSERKLADIGRLEWLEWAGISRWAGILRRADIGRLEWLIIREGRVE